MILALFLRRKAKTPLPIFNYVFRPKFFFVFRRRCRRCRRSSGIQLVNVRRRRRAPIVGRKIHTQKCSSSSSGLLNGVFYNFYSIGPSKRTNPFGRRSRIENGLSLIDRHPTTRRVVAELDEPNEEERAESSEREGKSFSGENFIRKY